MKQLSLKRMSLLLIVSAFLFSFTTAAAEKANFSGDWKLNEGKSELGGFGGRFAARTIKVAEKEDSITIIKTVPSFNGGENTSTETLAFDGTATESTLFNGAIKKSTAKWSADGQTLTIDYTVIFERNGQINEIIGSEAWILTKEGNLSLDNISSSPMGDISSKAVYDK